MERHSRQPTGATACNIRGTTNLDDIGTGGFLIIGIGPGLYESTITCFGPTGTTTDTMFFQVFLEDSLAAGGSSLNDALHALLPGDSSVERDLDGDRKPERIEFSAASSTLTIVFTGRDGRVEMTKVFDKVTDLRSVAIKVERTQEGQREISLRPLR